MRIDLQDETDAEIPLSPLIDCVFLLLVFFLVATMVKKENKDINIDLPVAEAAVKLRPDDDQLVIGIDPDGTMYLDGVRCDRNWLHTSLREIGLESPERRIRIDVDSKVPFKYFAEVMDACQFHSLSNVGLRTYDEYYNRR